MMKEVWVWLLLELYFPGPSDLIDDDEDPIVSDCILVVLLSYT